MRIAATNWMQVEAYLNRDDRCVLPIGSTEQHAYLSLSVDSILAGKVAEDAAAPLGVPVFPVMPYGITPYFAAYPGTITLKVATLLAVVRDIVASLDRAGFRRILIVNGHGGNAPVGALAQELMVEAEHLAIKFHDWWKAPQTWAKAQAIDPEGSHASWMENFPWTRLADVALPAGKKPMADMAAMRAAAPSAVRRLLGDVNLGGEYQKPDETMLALWEAGVAETREALEGPWPSRS
jgi:creatinine amidohydrolase